MKAHDRCRKQMRFIRRFVQDFRTLQQSQNELLAWEGLQKRNFGEIDWQALLMTDHGNSLKAF